MLTRHRCVRDVRRRSSGRRHGQVGDAVAVEVRYGHGPGLGAGGVGGSRDKTGGRFQGKYKSANEGGQTCSIQKPANFQPIDEWLVRGRARRTHVSSEWFAE